MKIPGYDTIFPKSWDANGTARALVYVKKSFQYEHIDVLESNSFQSVWIRGHLKNNKNIYFCHGYREHMSDTPIAHQRDILNEFVYQWEFALEHENVNDVNEVHVCLDMNLDSLHGKWLDPTYKIVSLSRIVQNICDIGNFS